MVIFVTIPKHQNPAKLLILKADVYELNQEGSPCPQTAFYFWPKESP